MDIKIPHALLESIKQKKLLLFIGAGVSKLSGLPLWKEIVIKTLEDPNIEKGVHFKYALVNEIMTPLAVLDCIEKTNKKDVYKYFESETSQHYENSIYQTLSRLSRKFVTTNYDCLIEENTKIKEINTFSTYNLQKIDELDEFILKIHGTSTAIDNAVVFTSDYEKLYSDDSVFAKFQLNKLISSHSCLFIGYSLSDNYVVELFDKLNKLYDGLGRGHYIISTEKINHDFVDTIKIDSHNEIYELLEHIANNILDDSDVKYSSLTTPNDSESNENILDDEFYLTPGHDTPPKIENWAGRTQEMEALRVNHKACFITGIGGQGKSALASKFLSEADRGLYKYCDWRDFKEEELNFQTKLYHLIELVSDGEYSINKLIGLESDNLVDIFFNMLGDKKGMFVFDNIDKYIDLQKFTPTGDMKIFFEKVISSPHNSRFIFTCRPFIHFAGVGSYQIRLEGLKLDEIKEFVIKYHNKIKEDELNSIVIRLHQCTQGHPLWMGLILAQSRVDIKQIEVVLKKIERREISEYDSNFSSIISGTVLENLWEGLKEREKIILRTLSICNISESQDELSKIVSKKINHNQFSKGLKSLKSLNLLVSKEGESYVELHPLVREFIKGKYDKKEQETYIALYVNYLDGFIFLLKSKFGTVLPQDDIELVIKKVEILINAGRTQDAINEISLTSDSFIISGYCEEYLRLTDLILDGMQWAYKKLSNTPGFSEFIDSFFTRSADFGRYDLFDKYMAKYSDIFQTADAHMILYKSSQCHKYWVEGDFESAIKSGKSASDLIDILGDKDSWSGKHRYFLALRDSKKKENIELALNYFREGKNIEELITDKVNPDFSTHYGNIGRCLLYLNDYKSALTLVCKSYSGFMIGGLSYFEKHNIGYAAKWISEILLGSGDTQGYLYFLLHAKNIWKNDMPGESNKIGYLISILPQTVENQSIISLEIWQIAKYCDDWVESFLAT